MSTVVAFAQRKFWEVDPRIKFLVGFIGSLFLIVIEREVALLVAFIVALLWCTYCGKWKTAIALAIVYGLLHMWAQHMIMNGEGIGGILVSVTLFRRFMLIGAFVVPLATVEIGQMVAAMYKLKLHRFAIISMAILFRFIPTFADEYRSVRTSQKFRGIGRTLINVIAHPIVFYETLLVPLAIRMMRVSDELSASAMLRGADRSTNGTCFRQIKILPTDIVVFVLFLLGITLSTLINYSILLPGVVL